MINGDNVTLRIFPQVSNVTRYETITTGSGVGASSYSVPVISVRSVETYLRHADSSGDDGGTLQAVAIPAATTGSIFERFAYLCDFHGKNYSKK